MPTPSESYVATMDTTGLASQITAEDDAAFDSAKRETAQPQGRDGASTSKSSDEAEDKGQAGAEAEKPSDESTPSEAEGSDKKETKADVEGATLKIGNREFATAADAVSEANRVIGRNGQLVGQLNTLTDKLKNASSESETYRSQFQKAQEVNQQWVAWYEKATKGERAEPPQTGQNVEELISKVLQTERAKQQEEATVASMKAELDKVESAPNYSPEVRRIVYQLSDQRDPITGDYFTPIQAYEYACRHLGIENALAPKPVQPPKEAPRSPVNKDLVKAASRNPSAPVGRGPTKTVAKRTQEDDLLDRSLMAGSLLPH